MEVRKNMPEEVKNQIIDGKKRVVTVSLPEKHKKIIEDKQTKKRTLAQQFYKISLNLVKGQKAVQDIVTQMENLDKSIGDRIQDGFKKLRLGKKKDRQWRFDGKGSFIGVYNPPKPKK